jgi:hypothetical protein
MKLNAIVLTIFLLIVNLSAIENPEDVKPTIQNGKGLFVLLDDTSWISQIVAEAYILGAVDGIILRKRALRALCGNTVDKALLTMPMGVKIKQVMSIVHQFLKDNPKDLYKPSVALIRQSLLRAFGQYDIAGY